MHTPRKNVHKLPAELNMQITLSCLGRFGVSAKKHLFSWTMAQLCILLVFITVKKKCWDGIFYSYLWFLTVTATISCHSRSVGQRKKYGLKVSFFLNLKLKKSLLIFLRAPLSVTDSSDQPEKIIQCSVSWHLSVQRRDDRFRRAQRTQDIWIACS